MKKQCFKCGRILDIQEFYQHPKAKDGHLNKCKECSKQDSRNRLRKYPEKVKEYELKRSKTPERQALRAFYVKKYNKEHPERNKANQCIKRALATGKIIRPKFCAICGKECKLYAHHHDYTKPLEVIFVCQSCHKKIHTNTL